jgi:hypothetical protein
MVHFFYQGALSYKRVATSIGLGSLCTAFALLASMQTATAGGFEPKTMQDTFEPNVVDRWLVIGKGWFQLDVTADSKVSTGYWDAEGNKQDFADTSWLHTTQKYDLTYGLTRYSQLSWTLRTHYVSLENDLLGTDSQQYGMGDPEVGYKYELFRTIKPLSSLAFYAKYKAPLANEAPGNYVGGPNTFSAFVFTTGTPDLSTGLQLKKGFGPAAVTLDLGYKYRIAGLTLYAIETNLNQFMMRIKPGDVASAKLDLDLQLGPAFLGASALFQHRTAFRIGNTAQGIDPNKNLEEVNGSDGWSLDAGMTVGMSVGHRFDVLGSVLIPIRGEDLQFFPIEDIHPTYGNTYSATMRYRF